MQVPEIIAQKSASAQCLGNENFKKLLFIKIYIMTDPDKNSLNLYYASTNKIYIVFPVE